MDIKFVDEHKAFLENEKLKLTEIWAVETIDFEANASKLKLHAIKDESGIIDQVKTIDELRKSIDELLKYNENAKVQIKDLKEKASKINEENAQAEKLHKEVRTLREANKTTLTACKIAFEKYSTCYNFELDVEDLQENRYTVVVKFKNDDRVCNYPIKFIVDGLSETVTDFNVDSICTDVENLELKNWLRERGQVTAFFCKLRKMIMNKIECDVN